MRLCLLCSIVAGVALSASAEAGPIRDRVNQWRPGILFPKDSPPTYRIPATDCPCGPACDCCEPEKVDGIPCLFAPYPADPVRHALPHGVITVEPVARLKIYSDAFTASKAAKDERKRLVLVFGMDGCAPCAALRRGLDTQAAADALSGDVVAYVHDMEYARRLEVTGFPTTIVYDGKYPDTEVARVVGYNGLSPWLAKVK